MSTTKKRTRASRRAAPACSAEDLYVALRESVKLQSHYAGLLNGYDRGERRPFSTPEAWITRLREIGDLPNASALPPQRSGGRQKQIVRKSPRPVTAAQLKKRKAAADSLCGIWANLPEDVQKKLMEKTY